MKVLYKIFRNWKTESEMILGSVVRLSAVFLIVLISLSFTAGNSSAEILSTLCFFREGSANLPDGGSRAFLTCRETAIYFGQVAQRSTQGRLHLTIHGYAPDASSEAESDRLSLLRALAVAEELRRASVPIDAITVIGNGSKRRFIEYDSRSRQNFVAEIHASNRYD